MVIVWADLRKRPQEIGIEQGLKTGGICIAGKMRT